jgi:hypothetical protein
MEKFHSIGSEFHRNSFVLRQSPIDVKRRELRSMLAVSRRYDELHPVRLLGLDNFISAPVVRVPSQLFRLAVTQPATAVGSQPQGNAGEPAFA